MGRSLGVLLLLAFPAALQAQPGSDPHASLGVTFEAPPECPEPESFARRVRERLDQPAVADTPLHVKVTRTATGYRGRLVRTVKGRRFERHVEGTPCGALTDALALVTALVLQGRGPALRPVRVEPTAEAKAPSRTQPTRNVDRGRTTAAPTPPARAATAEQGPRAQPGTQPRPTAPSARDRRTIPDDPGVRLRLRGGAQLGQAPHPMPLVMLGGSLTLGTDLELTLWAGGSPLTEVRIEAGRGAWWWSAAGTDLCYSLGSQTRWAGALCAGLEFGAFMAAGEGTREARRATPPWIAASAAGSLRYQPPGSAWFAEALLALPVPLRRERFVVLSGHVLHEVPAVTLRMALGLGVELH